VIREKKTKAKGNNRKRPRLAQKKNENQKKKRRNKGPVQFGDLLRKYTERTARKHLTQAFYLTHMHHLCILIHMRTTLNIDDKILEKASRLTGVKEKTSLVRLGLEALIARESSKRLAKLGGTEDNLRSIPRRRSA
jgi:Arc/MetJ family transcription regulator